MGLLTNILHFSADGDAANYGDRIPAVFIKNGGLLNSYIQIASAVSGNKNHMVNIKFYVGIDYQIVIRQYKDGGQYWYEIIVNGRSEYKLRNSEAKTFRNVKLYASNPWTTSFTADYGNVCNIDIRGHQ